MGSGEICLERPVETRFAGYSAAVCGPACLLPQSAKSDSARPGVHRSSGGPFSGAVRPGGDGRVDLRAKEEGWAEGLRLMTGLSAIVGDGVSDGHSRETLE